MNTANRSIAPIAAFFLLMAMASSRLLADPPPANAHPAADPHAPQKLQKDALIEIESAFFEVPEEEAKRLGLMSIPEDPTASATSAAKTKPKIVAGAAEVASILEAADAKRLLRAVNQAKGFRLLSAPRVSTKSGQRAVIEVIREFRYPTEFEHDKSSGAFMPTAFETRNIGITLEVEPAARPDDIIDLQLVPQIVKLEGYVRASDGQPVPLRDGRSVGADLTLKDLATVKFPTDTVLQPIFSTSKVVAHLPLLSGQSVLLGGMRKDEHEDGKELVTRFLYVLITAHRVDLPAAAPDVLPVAFIDKADAEGFVRSPFAPEAKAIDARGLPSGTELKCPVTKKLFRLR